MARKTAADVHLELAVHQKEMSERLKTAFNKFNEIDLNIKDLDQKISRGQGTIIILLVGLLVSVVTLVMEGKIL